MNDRKAVRVIINDLDRPPRPVPEADGARQSSLFSSVAGRARKQRRIRKRKRTQKNTSRIFQMNMYEVFRVSRKAILFLFDRRKFGELLFERFPPKIPHHFYDIGAREVRAPPDARTSRIAHAILAPGLGPANPHARRLLRRSLLTSLLR
ncbi:MAG TPA: hypothetical protein VKS80_14245 [Trinickia sp.]|nr:hypothetical protein [Trinickia sp.]